jgi:outer membrane protein OmpA-like peptidoglycan-associated protein
MENNINKTTKHLKGGVILVITILILFNNGEINMDWQNTTATSKDTIFQLYISKYYNDCFIGKPSEELELSLKPIVDFVLTKDLQFCEIGCYTNCLLQDSLSKEISIKRGENVLSYLIEKGVKPNLISVEFYGNTIPLLVKSDSSSFPINTVINCDSIKASDNNYKNIDKMKPKTLEAYRLMERIEIKIYYRN